MPQTDISNSTRYKRAGLLIVIFLAFVQGIISFFWLLSLPSDPKNVVLVGFSAERLGMAGGLVSMSLLTIWLFYKVLVDSVWYYRFDRQLQSWFGNKRTFGITTLLLLGVVISGSYFLLITPVIDDPFTKAIFLRISPIVFFTTGLGLELLLTLTLLYQGSILWGQIRGNRGFYYFMVVFVFFLLMWALSGWRNLDLQPDVVGWNTMGAPILETQVIFVVLIGFLLLGIASLRKGGSDGKKQAQKKMISGFRLDLAISVTLWLIAAVYWISLPWSSGWYISAPRYPNSEFYPNSDAVVYDSTAQSVLVGERFKSWDLPFPRRPMYAGFLAGLNALTDHNYKSVVLVQAAIFAVFPALVYLLTKTLSNRLAGVLAGVLALLREGNAIALTSTITVSHSRMEMADFPTALGAVLFAWLAVSWLRKPNRRRTLPLVAGGVLAVVMQIRVEVGVYLLVVLFISVFILYKRPVRWVVSAALLLVGIILVLGPWVWRNYSFTGMVFLEVPDQRIHFLLERLGISSKEENLPPTSEPPTPSGEIEADQGTGNLKTLQEDQAQELQTGQQATPSPDGEIQPGEVIAGELETDDINRVFSYLKNHYLHSQTQAVLFLPASFRMFDSLIGFTGHRSPHLFWEQCCSAENYIRRLPFWQWYKWEGEIPNWSLIPVTINLFLIALGIGRAFSQHKMIGLLPLLMSVAHFSVNALARTSGGRYILPGDSVWLVYYSVGLAVAVYWAFALIFRRHTPAWLIGDPFDNEHSQSSKKPSLVGWRTYTAIAVWFLVLGVSLPFFEWAIQPRYTEHTLQDWLGAAIYSENARSKNPETTSIVREFLSEGGEIYQGRALYPRFHKANRGEPGDTFKTFNTRPFARFDFYLVGPTNTGVILPLEGKPVVDFPHAVDVLVIGCKRKNQIDALAVFIEPPDGNVLLGDYQTATFNCPLPEPGRDS